MGQGQHATLNTEAPVHSDEHVESWLQNLIAQG